jgi:hypothetical protein
MSRCDTRVRRSIRQFKTCAAHATVACRGLLQTESCCRRVTQLSQRQAHLEVKVKVKHMEVVPGKPHLATEPPGAWQAHRGKSSTASRTLTQNPLRPASPSPSLPASSPSSPSSASPSQHHPHHYLRHHHHHHQPCSVLVKQTQSWHCRLTSSHLRTVAHRTRALGGLKA